MYIDTGFGSLLFQSIAALAVSCGICWSGASAGKIKKILSKSEKSVRQDKCDAVHSDDSLSDDNGFLK